VHIGYGLGPTLCYPDEQTLTFEQLGTKAHDMVVAIANLRDSSFSVAESKNDRAEFKKNVKFSISSIKETMTISKVGPIQISRGPNQIEKRSAHFKDTIRRRPTLKNYKRRNIRSLIRICQECWMIFLKKWSFSFQRRRGPKMLEGLLTPNTVIIIGW